MKGNPTWNTLVYITTELGKGNPLLKSAKNWEGIRLLALEQAQQMERLPEKEKSLLVSPCANTLRIARGLSIATVACLSPEFPGEDLSQEPMVAEDIGMLEREFFLRRYQRFHNIPWTIAETERCIIRELGISDVPALIQMYRTLPAEDDVEPLLPLEEEIKKQQAYITHMYHFCEFGMWLVFEKHTGDLIGRAGLGMFELSGKSCVELGYVIAPEYRKKGYATEICRKILEYAREILDIMEIYLRVHPDNAPSIALAGKLGFTEIKMVSEQSRPLRVLSRSIRS